jgi:class 3 adenylate cyclase/TolB-like protein
MDLEDELQQLMEKRREIDRALLERHAADMAVLFTDIVGSTAYFEKRGDIEGLALVRRHNDLLFPVVAAHRGRIVKTIGDAIMAVFDRAEDGVACAVALQERLASEAVGAGEERIRIRIGVHAGRVLKDGDDVFGDTVNTAARVQGAADAEEIVVSVSCLEALPAGHGWLAMPRPPLAAKGKSAPVAVVSIAWRPEDKADLAALSPAARELFLLEIGRGPAGLRVAAMDGEAERGTVKAYADVSLAGEQIERLAEPFAVLAHDGGQAAYTAALVDKGRALFETTLPERVRSRILETARHTVRLHLEDTLVHVPWELCHDGQDFLGCRFSIGRMVAARADAAVPAPGAESTEAVVVANPSGDLLHAEEEGRMVAALFEQAMPGRVVHKSGALTRAELLALAARARVLHFAGHIAKKSAAQDGGFLVKDGVVTPGDLEAALGRGAPLLVFANGCHASTGERWQEGGASSLAQALLLAGVRHSLAPLWSVPDSDALSFALRFYEAALAGVPFGEATRRARRALASSHTAPLSFAGYILYGDPRATLPQEDARLPLRGRTRSGSQPRVASQAASQPASQPAPQPAPQEAATLARTPSARSARPPPTPAPTPAASTPAALTPAALTPVGPTPLASGTAPAPPRGLSIVALGAAGGLVIGAVLVAALALSRGAPEVERPGEGGGAEVQEPGGGAAPAPAPGARVHTGPVRVSVMPFKSSGAPDAAFDYLKLGLPEVLVTAFAESAGRGVQIIERGQIDVDIQELEFSQSKYVDPATRAALGKIGGAEVAVLGAYQVSAAGGEAKPALRFTARFVDVETGEILAAAKVDGKADDVFGLQDALAVEVKKAIADVQARMRPAGGAP